MKDFYVLSFSLSLSLSLKKNQCISSTNENVLLFVKEIKIEGYNN